jgi:hypothetical protein
MVHRIWILSLLLLAAHVQAEMYRWTGPDGKVHYSDQPPSTAAKEQKLDTIKSRPAAPAASEGAQGGAKSVAEQEAEFRKRRVEAEEKRAKDEKQLAEAKEHEHNCRVARGQLQDLESGRRMTAYNEKGERVYSEEAERASRIAQAKKTVASWCK